jgi:hypothetical protein
MTAGPNRLQVRTTPIAEIVDNKSEKHMPGIFVHVEMGQGGRLQRPLHKPPGSIPAVRIAVLTQAFLGDDHVRTPKPEYPFQECMTSPTCNI